MEGRTQSRESRGLPNSGEGTLTKGALLSLLSGPEGCGALQSGRPRSSSSGVLITHSLILQLQSSPDLPPGQLPAIHTSKYPFLLCSVPLGLLSHRPLSWVFPASLRTAICSLAWFLSRCPGGGCGTPLGGRVLESLASRLEWSFSLAATASISHICSSWGHGRGACLVSGLLVASTAHSQLHPEQALPCLLTTWWGPCSACLVVSRTVPTTTPPDPQSLFSVRFDT